MLLGMPEPELRREIDGLRERCVAPTEPASLEGSQPTRFLAERIDIKEFQLTKGSAAGRVVPLTQATEDVP